MRSILAASFGLALMLVPGQVAIRAQKPPEAGYLFPPSAAAGSSIEAQLGGYDFTADMQFFVHHPDVKLSVLGPPGEFLVPEPPYWFGPKGRSTAFPIPREVPVRIDIPADMPPGPVLWQVANANGASTTGVFLVGEGREVLESRYGQQPQVLKDLPVTICGRIEKITEVDRYRWTARQDGPITVELMARQLGSNFHGLLEVRDRSGRLVADAADTEGVDTSVTFPARAGDRYEICLHDIDFRGNRAFVYRLRITAGPRVAATIPACVPAGQLVDMQFIGYGVSTGSAVLESVRRQVKVPAEMPRGGIFRYRLATPFGMAIPVELAVSDLPELSELELKDRQLIGDCAVTGTLDDATRDRYTIAARKGETWQLTAQSRAVGTRLDLSLQVLDVHGKELAANDDLPGTLDAGLSFAAAADGDYTLVISDVSDRSHSPVAVYRIVATRAQADFALQVPQRISVPLGGKTEVAVKTVRTGGFDGEITLRVEGLPEGIQLPAELTIPADKAEVKVAFEASPDAATSGQVIRITGEAEIGQVKTTRIALAAAEGNLCPPSPERNRTTQILLVPTMKPPFSVELVDKNRQRAVHRGTTYPAEFVIRREDGFDGEVLLQMAARQSRHRQGISGPIVSVPPGTDRALYPCFMPEWLETDRTTRMAVMGVAKVADPTGNVRYLTRDADARITMILEGALLKLSHQAGEITIFPGQSFDVPLEVVRSAKLSQPVTIELAASEELEGLVRAEPIVLPPERSRCLVRVHTVADRLLSGDRAVKFKATALQQEQWPVVSETDVPVRFATR